MNQPTKESVLSFLEEMLETKVVIGKKAQSFEGTGHWSVVARPDSPILVLVERVTEEKTELVLTTMHWGYDGDQMYNARTESVRTTSMWSDDFAKRRCIIPLSMFREGRGAGTAFARPNDEPILAAGIFSAKENYGLRNVSMLTTMSAGLVRNYHDRQPAVVPEEMVMRYLDRTHTLSDADRLKLMTEKQSLIIVG
jgi:putative SOS response-associated peptidase YedK